jgi:hypothetical protein
MKTLIICASAPQAKALERLFWPKEDDEDHETVCVGAGEVLAGYHFHRIIYMPGWNRDNPESYKWRELVVRSRMADRNFHSETYL